MKKMILTAAIIFGLTGMNAAFAETKIAIVDVHHLSSELLVEIFYFPILGFGDIAFGVVFKF